MTHTALMGLSDYGVLTITHQQMKESFRYVEMIHGMQCVDIVGIATLVELFVDPWDTQEQYVSNKIHLQTLLVMKFSLVFIAYRSNAERFYGYYYYHDQYRYYSCHSSYSSISQCSSYYYNNDCGQALGVVCSNETGEIL